jgi:hypothetical protein
MKRAVLAALAATALTGMSAASAATINLANGTIFTDQSAFLAALGFTPDVIEDFESYGDVDLTSGTNPLTLSASGIVLTVDPDDQTGDTRILNGALRLSTNRDNSDGPAGTNALTATLDLPFATNFVSFDFNPQGVNNDSGTLISFVGTGVDDFDTDLLNGGSNGNVLGDTGYTGFFGFISNAGPFTQIVFSSENSTLDAVDDDFAIDNIAANPVPVPAAALLMPLGLAALARRRRAAK